MKLLFDQNVSFRLIHKLSGVFPEARQVRQIGLENCSDIDIWTHAKLNGFSIVTFDADFFDLSSLNGHPPKIIWLRFGNTTTDALANRLIEKAEIIKEFIEAASHKEFACLEIK